MKKIVIAIIIFLYTTTVTSYAGVFTNNEESTGHFGSLYGNGNSSNNSGGDSGYGALFRVPADGTGDRPGIGEGIGQEAPLGDGLSVMIACCVVLVVVKTFNDSRNKM